MGSQAEIKARSKSYLPIINKVDKYVNGRLNSGNSFVVTD